MLLLGNYRTIDLNYSVAKVGSTLTDLLNTKGYNVSHLLDYHDYPQYNGSYTSNNISPQVVLDIHRDAVRK